MLVWLVVGYSYYVFSVSLQHKSFFEFSGFTQICDMELVL